MKLIKTIEVSGKNGIFSGTITIFKGYKNEPYQYHNHSTHDEETRYRTISKIEAKILDDNDIWKVIDDLTTENQIERESDKLDKEFMKHLEFLETSTPEKTFQQKMSEKGFK